MPEDETTEAAAQPEGVAAAEHPPSSCPTEGCPNAAVAVPYVSDQGSALDLFGKCIGCLQTAGELNEGKIAEIVAESDRRGVVRDVDPVQQLTAMVNQLLAEVAGLRREVGAVRLGVGACLQMQIGQTANLPQPVVVALGMQPEAIEKTESSKRGEGIQVVSGGFDVRKLRGRLN